MGRVILVTKILALQWLPCQALGVIGSALGHVGPVSVYCDWVRGKVWSATSVSVWQHVKLSEQIRPWATLACCWTLSNQQTRNTWCPSNIHRVPQRRIWLDSWSADRPWLSHPIKVRWHRARESYHCFYNTRGRYHGGRRPSSDDSFHSPTVIPPSAFDKPSIMKRYHRRWTTRWGVRARLSTMVTLHDTRFVECRWWNDGWTVKTFVTWRSSASMIPAPGDRQGLAANASVLESLVTTPPGNWPFFVAPPTVMRAHRGHIRRQTGIAGLCGVFETISLSNI